MEINYDKLVREWSERMNDRAPIYTNRYHRTVLREVMKDFGYPLWLLGELALTKDAISKKDKPYDAKTATKVVDNANAWIAEYTKKLKIELKKFGGTKGNFEKPDLVGKETKFIKGKGKKSNRIQYILKFPEVGNNSRDPLFDAAKAIKMAAYKTTYTTDKTQASVGSVIHIVKKPKSHTPLEYWVSFKGGKSSKKSGKTTTDIKECFCGLFFQSEWDTVVTKDNIGECVETLKDEIDGIKGEHTGAKSEVKKYLKTIPYVNPPKAFLDELNQPLSVAKRLQEKYKSHKWVRDTVFDNVRETGGDICGVPDDKWNPGDVYLVKGTLNTNSGPGGSISTKIAPLNAQFDMKWGAGTEPAVSVSLKLENAQAGKAKSYLKTLETAMNVKKFFDYNLNKGEQDRLGLEPESWVPAYIQQIQKWRDDIKSSVSGLSINYDYNPAGSLMSKATQGLTKDFNKFVFQKYANIKMFKFMVNSTYLFSDVIMDSAAFGAGLTGFSPTFFKVTAQKSGNIAPVKQFEGNGGITLVGNKIKIEDTNTSAGIIFTFKVNNPVMGDNNVKMNIRFNGTTQSTLELLKFG